MSTNEKVGAVKLSLFIIAHISCQNDISRPRLLLLLLYKIQIYPIFVMPPTCNGNSIFTLNRVGNQIQFHIIRKNKNFLWCHQQFRSLQNFKLVFKNLDLKKNCDTPPTYTRSIFWPPYLSALCISECLHFAITQLNMKKLTTNYGERFDTRKVAKRHK